jgi:lipopolysaccharide export system protein LptA
MIRRTALASLRLSAACALGMAVVLAGLVLIGLALAGLAPAHAQGGQQASASKSSTSTSSITGPPNAVQGFSQNRDKPIQIDAARLEVRDKSKIATFFGDAKGDVKVVQGDTTMRSKTLEVYYEQDNASSPGGKSAKAATPGPGGSSQIKKLIAIGSVIVTQKDQTVTGAKGEFDMKTNTIVMTGTKGGEGVIMTQGDNVLRGERLVVDMTTGVSRVEGGRVQGLFKSNSQPSGGGGSAPPGAGRAPGLNGLMGGGSR